MKNSTPVAVLILAISSFTALTANAQVGELYNATLELHENIEDPAIAAKKADSGWVAFSIPQLQSQASPCCWKGGWKSMSKGMSEANCELGRAHQSYGTWQDSPTDDSLVVFNQIKDGAVVSSLVAGASCPVDAGGAEVIWIGSVDEQAGIDWLAEHADEDDSSLYALGLHRSVDAGHRLSSIASGNNDDLSEQAIFWLGEARGQQGFQALKQLLDQLPAGETRKHINFALAQNKSTEAVQLLEQIAQTDKDTEQRSDALFWLAQEYPQQAKPILVKFMQNERDDDALEQAVFAISQLGDNSGDELLFELARDNNASREVRRQALFWLAQSDNDATVTALAQMLSD